MIKSKEVKLAAEIAFLFTVIDVFLSFINLLGSVIIKDNLKIFTILNHTFLRFIIAAVIAIILGIIIKQYFKEDISDIIRNSKVILITGVITIVDSIMGINLIPVCISGITSSLDIINQHPEFKNAGTKTIATNSLSIFVILLHIIIAIWLIVFYRKLKLKNDQNLSVQSSQK